MTAFEYLKSLKYLPGSTENKHYGRPSNSEIRRWLLNGSVIIDGDKPKPDDIVYLPIWELIFFPNSKRKTTMIEFKLKPIVTLRPANKEEKRYLMEKCL